MASERKIGAHVYRCDKLPADLALPLFLRTMRFFREAPGALASVAEGKGDDGKKAFLTLCLSGELGEAETTELLKALIESCTTGGDPCVMGVKPQTLPEMVDVAWFAMEVQFKDFLLASLADS